MSFLDDFINYELCFPEAVKGSTEFECRFEQHKRYAYPEHERFPCDCFGEPTQRFFLNRHSDGGTRGNSFAAQYGLGLAPQFLPEVHVFDTREEAEAREASLADELRHVGHAVWQG